MTNSKTNIQTRLEKIAIIKKFINSEFAKNIQCRIFNEYR